MEVTEVFVKDKWIGGDDSRSGFKNMRGEASEVRTTGILKFVACKKEDK